VEHAARRPCNFISTVAGFAPPISELCATASFRSTLLYIARSCVLIVRHTVDASESGRESAASPPMRIVFVWRMQSFLREATRAAPARLRSAWGKRRRPLSAWPRRWAPVLMSSTEVLSGVPVSSHTLLLHVYDVSPLTSPTLAHNQRRRRSDPRADGRREGPSEVTSSHSVRAERRGGGLLGRTSFLRTHTRPTVAREPSPEVYRAVREARKTTIPSDGIRGGARGT
jgi:hypothetical protein